METNCFPYLAASKQLDFFGDGWVTAQKASRHHLII
jgi:hypothetical protein